REVTRVVTPGTVTEDDLLDPHASNHLVALVIAGPTAPVGLVWLELSTGQFLAADVPAERLHDELTRLAPAECLCPEKHADAVAALVGRLPDAPALTGRPDWTFDPATARAALQNHFRVTTFAGFGFDDAQSCLTAAGALLLYVQEMLKA